MATNASTWFYAEPEHRAYLLEERVNHTFWNNRITDLYLDCFSEKPPFCMAGQWHDAAISIEWVPKDYFILTTRSGDSIKTLITGIEEILGFKQSASHVDTQGNLIVEWRVKQGK